MVLGTLVGRYNIFFRGDLVVGEGLFVSRNVTTIMHPCKYSCLVCICLLACFKGSCGLDCLRCFEQGRQCCKEGSKLLVRAGPGSECLRDNSCKVIGGHVGLLHWCLLLDDFSRRWTGR